MPDLVTPAKGLTEPTIGSDNNIWGGILNTDLSLIDSALGGTLAKSISTSVSLTGTEAQNTGFHFTGGLSGTATITFPAFRGMAALRNHTTGGFSIICAISGGASVTVLDGETVAIWADGTDFIRLAATGGGATVPNSGLANSSITISGHTISLGGSQNLVAGDISGLATVATSGSAIDLTTGTLPNGRLSAVPNSALANSSVTLSGHSLALGGSLALAAGDVSGLAAVATSGSATDLTTGTLPNARLSAVPNSALANSSVTISGHSVALGGSQNLVAGDVSGLAAVATSGSATDLTTGTLPNARLSAVPNSALANSSVTISGHSVALGGSVALVAGDVSGLAAVATSGSATDLTTGTLPNARLSAVPNSALANSSITIAGHSVALGGSQALAASDLTNGTFGSGAVVLRTGLPYVDVKANGAAGDGSTDDASVINLCITAITSTGGIVFFPPGIYVVGSSITILSKVTLLGSGRGATIIRAKSSTAVDVVKTANFGTLTGSNTDAGAFKFALRGLSIDGNKAASSTGNGVTIYGLDFNIEDVEIYNCSNVCLYSEWGLSGTVPTTADGDSMEAHIHGLKTWGAGVDGIQWFGPHDSTMDDVQTFINGRYGLYVENTANYSGGGTMFSNFHSYGNANHGVLCNANIYCDAFESESNTGGDGIHIIDTSFGFFDARGVSVYNNSGSGFNITAGYATIAGIQAFNNTGNGILVGAAATMSDVVAYSNGGMGVHVTADSWVFSAVRVFSNTGNGMQIDAPSTTNGVYTYNNGGHGLVINASDSTVDGVNAQNNTGTGIKINGTLQSLVVSGKASGNATQLDLGTVDAPSIIDVTTFNTASPAGQVSYTGTPGDVFLRIATAGTGALSALNQVQT